jgi:hypothetical protein
MIWLALFALVLLPMGYYALHSHMRDSDVPHPPSLQFFFLFGTVGGWLVAIMLSPSGLAATCVLLLLTAASLALLISSLHLAIRPERSVYHRIAMWGGFVYPAILVLVYGVLVIVAGFLKDRI